MPAPTVYKDAVKYLHALTLNYAVCLLIDSLDQLVDAYLARSDISFLKDISCHHKSRVIVRALPDEKKADGKGWLYIIVVTRDCMNLESRESFLQFLIPV